MEIQTKKLEVNNKMTWVIGKQILTEYHLCGNKYYLSGNECSGDKGSERDPSTCSSLYGLVVYYSNFWEAAICSLLFD